MSKGGWAGELVVFDFTEKNIILQRGTIGIKKKEEGVGSRHSWNAKTIPLQFKQFMVDTGRPVAEKEGRLSLREDSKMRANGDGKSKYTSFKEGGRAEGVVICKDSRERGRAYRGEQEYEDLKARGIKDIVERRRRF